MKQLVSLFLCAAILTLFLTGCRAEPVLEDAQEPAVSKDTLEQTGHRTGAHAVRACLWKFRCGNSA